MIRSMTAFSRVAATDEQSELVWELRSVNHRYLETHFRLPEEMRVLEPLVRERLARRLGRGKVDCALRFKSTGTVGQLQINQLLADQVGLQALRNDAGPAQGGLRGEGDGGGVELFARGFAIERCRFGLRLDASP